MQAGKKGYVEIIEQPRHSGAEEGSPKRTVLDFGRNGGLHALERHIDDGVGRVQYTDEGDEGGNGGGKEDRLQYGHRGGWEHVQANVKEHRTQQLDVTSEMFDYPAAALKQQENRPCRRHLGRICK